MMIGVEMWRTKYKDGKVRNLENPNCPICLHLRASNAGKGLLFGEVGFKNE